MVVRYSTLTALAQVPNFDFQDGCDVGFKEFAARRSLEERGWWAGLGDGYSIQGKDVQYLSTYCPE